MAAGGLRAALGFVSGGGMSVRRRAFRSVAFRETARLRFSPAQILSQRGGQPFLVFPSHGSDMGRAGARRKRVDRGTPAPS